MNDERTQKNILVDYLINEELRILGNLTERGEGCSKLIF